MPTRFRIADLEIGRLSQRRGTVRLVQRYALIQIGRPSLAVPAQTVLAWPAIYRKTPVQSRANLTVYIRTISGLVDLTCILYMFLLFAICARISPAFYARTFLWTLITQVTTTVK